MALPVCADAGIKGMATAGFYGVARTICPPVSGISFEASAGSKTDARGRFTFRCAMRSRWRWKTTWIWNRAAHSKLQQSNLMRASAGGAAQCEQQHLDGPSSASLGVLAAPIHGLHRERVRAQHRRRVRRPQCAACRLGDSEPGSYVLRNAQFQHQTSPLTARLPRDQLPGDVL